MLKRKSHRGGLKLLSVVVLLMLYTTFFTGYTLATDYTDYYNIDSGDLLRAYQFWRQQSVDFYPEYYSEGSSIFTIWNEADKTFSGELQRSWETIADSLNQALYNNFNSKVETASYEDRNLLCLFIPSMNLNNIGASGSQTMWFMFIPYPYRTLKASETRGAQTVSGETEYYYSYQLRLATSGGEINTNLSNVTNNFLLMAVPLNTAQSVGFITKEGTNNSFFTQWTKYYRSKYSWTRPQLNTNYGYGLFKTFRNYIERDGCQIFYHSYDMMSGLTVLSRIYYYFDMQDNSIYSYDSAPQDPSSGDSGENSGENQNIGLTSGELLAVSIEVNNDYWGTSGDLSGEEQEGIINGQINEVTSSLSGEFNNNNVWKWLESGEKGFLNFFDANRPEEEYDLKIQWNDITYKDGSGEDKVIIPEGKLNFSEICRNDEALGYIQTLIRIIFNFNIAILIIKQIYNLILATLGIDNPYLYENPEEEHTTFLYNENTGQTTKTVRKGKVTRRKTI